MRPLHAVSVFFMVLLMVLSSACRSTSTPTAPTAAPIDSPVLTTAPTAVSEPTSQATVDFEKLENFDPDNFNDPTNIDNPLFPMKPGTQWIYEGDTEDAGQVIPHQVIITITDYTKVIADVRTVVTWDQDFSAGELVETELAFFAQDNDGNVWRLGEYPEVYEEGRLVEAPAWITGLKGARAGIIMPAEPQLGAPSYSQGWGPAVGFTDRGLVDQVDQQICVPLDCYENVLVIAEFSREEPDAFQLKYYANGVGNTRVGWRGADATKETLELVEFIQLNPESMAEVRAAVMELEQRAYEISKEVYDQTPQLETE
jgi:hypothetical protein